MAQILILRFQSLIFSVQSPFFLVSSNSVRDRNLPFDSLNLEMHLEHAVGMDLCFSLGMWPWATYTDQRFQDLKIDHF